MTSVNVSCWQILLQKSFCTSGQKFRGPLARYSCNDLRDLIALRQIHGRLR
jgi:hypothetical protein